MDNTTPVATVAQHQALAQLWCRYNGQKGTEKQSLRVMRQLTAIDLHRMLGERGVVLPLGCEAGQS
jgi:hypothetical protein